MKCPGCGRQSAPRTRSCPKCGASLKPSARRPGPAGIDPNLNAIAKTAARLCDAHDAQIFLAGGATLRLVAQHGSFRTTRQLGEPFPLSRGSIHGRAVLERRVIHVRDMKAAVRTQYPELKPRQRATGIRTMLAAPLLFDGTAIGAIAIRRSRVRPFTPKQIALLEAFAEHAATAIEKTRLAQVLAEALEQQTATSEILRVISSSPTDLQPVLDAIAASAARLCDSIDAQIFRIDGEVLRMAASYGALPKVTPADSRPINRGSVNGRAVVDRRTIHIHDLAAESDSEWPVAKAYQKRFGHRTTLATPLLREGVPLGAITVRRMEVRPFLDKQISLLETFADQAVIAIENVRLFTELQEKNRALTRAHAQMSEALEQQTATSEVLKVISRSTFDLEPVLATLIESAARLSGATQGFIFKFDGEFLRLAADYGTPAEHRDYWRENLLRPGPSSNSGRAAFERRTVHTHDALAQSEADPLYEHSQAQKVGGYRTVLAVPMLREEVLVGVLTIWKTKVEPFTDRQVELVESFADQAVIAIENVRLFRDLTEALEQQTATSEILRVISSSPTDVQPVMNVIAENAARVCGANDALVLRLDGDDLQPVANFGRIGQAPVRLSRSSVAGRAFVDRQTIHVHDLAAEVDTEFPDVKDIQKQTGHRTTLATPLQREGVAIGVILIRRLEVRPFSDKQIRLLETFADQAVIAIENVRLFKELEARNRDLSVALDRQTATSEVLRVIGSSPTDAQPVFDAIARSGVRLLGGFSGAVLRLIGDDLHLAAITSTSESGDEALRGRFPLPLADAPLPAQVVLERAPRIVSDTEVDPRVPGRVREVARARGYRSMLQVPMLREDTPIGLISVTRREPGPFADEEIALLQTFADQAVIAIENVRLFKELEARNRDLTEALEQQTATGEILRVISGSPTDIQPVLETLVESAGRLCQAYDVSIFRVDGDVLRVAAHHGPIAQESVVDHVPLIRGTIGGRSVLDRQTIHLADLQAETGEFPEGSAFARRLGHRTILTVPLLREGIAIGVISLRRAEVLPFTDKQIKLLETFADQAVIAIENVRLFKELEARNRDLTVALDRQTATSEVLRVIGSSPTNAEPVFDAIVRSAVRLLGGFSGAVLRLVSDDLHLAAITSTSELGDEAIRGRFPRPLADSPVQGQVVRERAPCVVTDMETDPRISAEGRQVARARGYRSMLNVPMLREDTTIGVLSVARREPGPFAAEEIELLKTFADQAVIAIENVRLFRDLTEALEQQTATSEILRVISSSPTDIQPVFDVISESSARLCNAFSGSVFRFDGELIHFVAQTGVTREGNEITRRLFPARPHRSNATARAIFDRAVVHIPDVREDPEYRSQEWASALGIRSVLSVPMVREGSPIGTITVNRIEPGPFPDRQVELLKTFADQAVIAVENVRLFKELDARNRDLTEALEQQTATAEILRAISSSPTDIRPVLETLVHAAARFCGAANVALLNLDGGVLRGAAAAGPIREEIVRRYGSIEALKIPVTRESVSGRAVSEHRTVHTHDLAAEPEGEFPVGRELQRQLGHRTVVATPLLREGTPIGAILLFRTEVKPFSDKQLELLRTFADQAVIAIENVRLFKELEGRNRDLTEALEQQTATSEILRVISQSQTDVQPVFETMAANALRLCDATFSAVSRFDGELIHLVALRNVTPERAAALREAFPMPPGRGGGAARAILTRSIVHIPDVREDPEYVLHGLAQTSNFRSLLSVPMLRDGHPIGAITVTADPARPFPDKQIALLQTFADQAVIAIENVRLFKELETRTGELTRSVEQLTALGEIGRAVSSTLDVETVLDTIVSRATQIAGADACAIYEFDEAAEQFHLRATHNFDADFVEVLRVSPFRKGEGVMGRAAEMRQPVQVPDITQPAAYQSGLRDVLIGAGYRAALSVPLLREDQIIGSLSLLRKTPGEFSPEVVELLKTFATQSALAIQNARLFREIEDKGRQLEVASRHKSEFLANMSHELRTPLNAIIGYSEMVQEEAEGLGAEGLVPDLKKINSAGKHLLDLINSVLDLSKIEAGKMDLYLETFSVPDMVRDIAGVVQPLAAKRSNRLQVRCDEGAGTMRADLTKVRQALFNLLSNACKFTERGTVSLTVGRDSTSAGEWLAFEVKDTGIGITPEQMTRLFHEFSQADAEVTRRYGGTGLGLALSRRLCRMMGGDISLESEAGRGSTFTIRLPASVAEPSAEAAAAGGAARPATGTAGTVLVIDDDATVRDLMERFLDKEGFRVVTAAGGQEGLRLAKELRPDAITLDVMMPAMDGWAVLSALKSDPELSDIPVIMLTILDARNMGYALGASDYLNKPIVRDRLAAVLKKYRRDLPVLVVDDDADLRRRLRRLLEQDGYTVAEAEHGRDALARLPEISPGLILLDLMMPEMDGFEFVVELRRHEAWRVIPVIVITARDLSAEDRRRLNGYVEKVLQKGAYSRDALLAEVRELVAASIARRRGAR